MASKAGIAESSDERGGYLGSVVRRLMESAVLPAVTSVIRRHARAPASFPIPCDVILGFLA